MKRVTGAAAVTSPAAALLASGTLPWAAQLALALSGPLTYALHCWFAYQLGCKALERAEPSAVPTVLAYGTGQAWPHSNAGGQHLRGDDIRTRGDGST